MADAAVVWLIVAAAGAQFDMAAVAKWNAAQVVRYQITGTFQGTTPLVSGPAALYAVVEVSDRVTLELDWDIRANAAIGLVKFANTATQLVRATAGKADCPPPKMSGAFEYLEVTAAASTRSGVELTGTRSYPAASISSEWPATCAQQAVRAAQEPVKALVPITSPVMLAMPAGSNPNFSVAADRKSFSVKSAEWKWTFTPSIVK